MVPIGSNHLYPCPLQDCYILDQSGTKIYVWKGRRATKTEKQTAMSKALVGATCVQYCPQNSVRTTSDVFREPDEALGLMTALLHTRTSVRQTTWG